jgi:hypothetical protein
VVISRRTLLLMLSVVLALVTGASTAVGYATPGEAFDWDVASIFGTAVGTTLLALATGVLAYTTSRDVSATVEIARLTKEDQDLRNRPIVLAEGISYDGSPKVDVRMRNVGLGPALGIFVTATYEGDGAAPTIIPLYVSALGPGEDIRGEVEAQFDQEPPGGILARFRIRGDYTDRDFSQLFELITDVPSRTAAMRPQRRDDPRYLTTHLE